MKSALGNLLLIGGTIAGSLAAASNERAFVERRLDTIVADDPETVLFEDLRRGATDAGEPIASAGEPLSAEAVAELRSRGVKRVRLRRQARTEEIVAVDEALVGRILAEPVRVDRDRGELLVPERAALRLARADAARAAFEADPSLASVMLAPDGQGGFAPAESEGESEGAPSSESIERAELEPLSSDARLSGLPPMLTLAPSGRFIDSDLADRLLAGDLERIRVRVPRPPFTFGGWPGSMPFALSVIAMLSGVVLLRKGQRERLAREDQEGADGPRPAERLRAIVTGLRELERDFASLSIDDRLARLDVLLTQDCNGFVEVRDGLRVNLGGSGYAAVMGPFATGERRLSRAWSATADGYEHEAEQSLSESIEPFEASLEALVQRSGVDDPHDGGSRDGGSRADLARTASEAPTVASDQREELQ
jgi:hypothetical protein